MAAAADLGRRVACELADGTHGEEDAEAFIARRFAELSDEGEEFSAAMHGLWALLDRQPPSAQSRGEFKFYCRGLLSAGLRRRSRVPQEGADRDLALQVLGTTMSVRTREQVVMGSLDVARLVHATHATAHEVGGFEVVGRYVSVLLRTTTRPHHTDLELIQWFDLPVQHFRPALLDCLRTAVAAAQPSSFQPSLVFSLCRAFAVDAEELGPVADYVNVLLAAEHFRVHGQLLANLLGVASDVEAVEEAVALAEVEGVAEGRKARLPPVVVLVTLSDPLEPPLANGYVRRILGTKLRKHLPVAVNFMQLSGLLVAAPEPHQRFNCGTTALCERETAVAMGGALLKLAGSDMDTVKAACRALGQRWWRLAKCLTQGGRCDREMAAWDVYQGLAGEKPKKKNNSKKKKPYLDPAVGVVVVEGDEQLALMWPVLLAAEVVGLDAEWTPNSTAEVETLQLATADAAFVCDLRALSLPALRQGLEQLLGSAQVRKVGFGLCADLERLDAVLPGGLPAVQGLFDLQQSATEGLSALTEAALGRSVDKRCQCSNWGQRPLSPQQVAYAALDAQCLVGLSSASAEMCGEMHPLGYIELRVGRMLRCSPVEGANELYAQEISLGGSRTVTAVSRFEPFFAPQELEGRLLVVVCNIKPRKLKGVVSEAGVLCVYSPADGGYRLELVEPAAAAVVGERVQLADFPVLQMPGYVIDTKRQARPWGEVQAGLRIDPSSLQLVFEAPGRPGGPLAVSSGALTVASLADGLPFPPRPEELGAPLRSR